MSVKFEYFVVAKYNEEIHKHSSIDIDGFSKRWLNNSSIWPEKIMIDSGEIELEACLLHVGGKIYSFFILIFDNNICL